MQKCLCRILGKYWNGSTACSLFCLVCMCVYIHVCVCLRVKKSISWLCLAFAQPCQAVGLDSFTFTRVFTSESLKFLFLLDVVFVWKNGLIIQSWVIFPFLFKMPCGCFHQIMDVYAPTPCWRSLSGGPRFLLLNLLRPLQPHLSHDLCLILPPGQGSGGGGK